MSDSDQAIVKCQCSARLRVPANAAGKRVKCPKCGFKIQIPADGAPAEVSLAPPAPPADEGDSLLDDLLESEASAETTGASNVLDSQTTCPSCHSPMSRSAVACPMCGHGGKPAVAPSAAASEARAAITRVATGGGRLLVGCIISGVGALVGAGIWYGVAVGTGYEVGYIAWGLGVAAGFGMMIGANEQSARAGLLAVVMSLVGIFAAKGMMFSYFVGEAGIHTDPERFRAAVLAVSECQAPYDLEEFPPWDERRLPCDGEFGRVMGMDDDEFVAEYDRLTRWSEEERWTDDAYVRAYLIDRIALDDTVEHFGDEAFAEDEEWTDEQREVWNQKKEAAIERVDNMTTDDRGTTARARHTDALQELDALGAETRSKTGVGSSLFFSTMFGGMDILFILLAVGSAYKLASGGGDE